MSPAQIHERNEPIRDDLSHENPSFDEEFVANIENRFCVDMSMQERAHVLFMNTEILAPMVRASTTALRTLALSYGADLVYTEEMVDRSILSCHRIINPTLKTIDYVRDVEYFSAKVQRRLKRKEEVPVILRIAPCIEKGRLIYQVGTGEANFALQAAQQVERDVDGIDINMGCPKKFSVSGGMGSALLSDVSRACDILKTLRRNLTKPVSAKIRLLKDNAQTVDFVRSLIQAGANAVTIHAREVGDSSTLPAQWDRLIEIVNILKGSSEGSTVPIIINGDLFTRNDMINMKLKAKADGVMLARPALYNTSIFRKPTDGYFSVLKSDEEETRFGYDSRLLSPKTKVVQDYLNQALLYQSNAKNAKYVLCEFMTNRRIPPNLVPHMPHSYPGGQTIEKVCKCNTLAELCTLWDLRDSVCGRNHSFEHLEVIDGHRYDDRYFLDAESFLRDRNSSNTTVDTNNLKSADLEQTTASKRYKIH